MNEKLVKILEAARNNPKVKEKFLKQEMQGSNGGILQGCHRWVMK